MADILDTYTFDTELIDLSNKGLTKLPDLTRCSYQIAFKISWATYPVRNKKERNKEKYQKEEQ